VLLGCGLSLLSYGLILLNIPNESPLGETTAEAFIGNHHQQKMKK
jgi:hypothetical protein